MSRRAKSIYLSLMFLPVLTGQMVLVLALTTLVHFATHDHDHDLSMHSDDNGVVSVEMGHGDHHPDGVAPTDLHPEGSHEFSLNGDYNFNFVKKLLQHTDQLAVLSIFVDIGHAVRPEHNRAYSSDTEDPPDRVPDRTVILRI
jgi:hypothetical protein